MGNAITIDELEEAYSTAEIQSRFFEILNVPNTNDMPTPEPFYYDAKTPEAYEPFGMLPLDVWNIVTEYLAVPELCIMIQINTYFVPLVKKAYEKKRKRRHSIKQIRESKQKIELPYQPQALAFRPNGSLLIVVDISSALYARNGLLLLSKSKVVQEIFSVKLSNGQEKSFSYLSDVCVTSDNHIIVSDYDDNCIMILNPAGALVRSFGQNGMGAGEIRGPSSVAVNHLGDILVSDRMNHRIQAFSREGQFLYSIGSEGKEDGQFQFPDGIAVNASGGFVVADSWNHRIQIFSKDRQFVRKFGTSGEGSGQFQYPRGVEIDNDGRIYVADTGNNRIQVFESDGTFVHQFGEELNNSPVRIRMKDSGAIYVVDLQEVKSISVF